MMLEPTETDATYRCTQCSHGAVWPFQLDRHIQRTHINVHTSEIDPIVAELELYSCIDCDFETCYKLSRYEHYKRKHGNNDNVQNCSEELGSSYCCNYCKQKGHSSLSLLKHSCDTEPVHKDLLAGVSLYSEIDVKPQILIDSSGGFDYEQRCYKTKDGSILEPRLLKHVAAVDKSQRFSCSKCSYRNKRKSELMKHMLVHASLGQKIYSCTDCSYRSLLERSVATHIKKTRGKCGEIKWFNCNTCSYRNRIKQNLTNHMLIHAAPEQITWFNCASCSYRTKRKGDLRYHMVTHDPRRYDKIDWFDCVKCSFRTKIKRSLMQHMLIHETNVLFNCTKCSYGTKRKGDLKSHMRMHAASDEIGWFSCTKCAHRVRSKGHLKRHMLTHTVATGDDDSVWFNCTECSFRARRQVDLKNHMQAIHALDMVIVKSEKIKWFDCTECSYSTKSKYSLKIHMVTKHTDFEEINWFRCTECRYRAKIKENLKVHVLKYHAKADADSAD